MTLVSFTPGTRILSADVNANFTGLSDGTLDVPNNQLGTYRDESFDDYVTSGCLWSGDSYGASLNGSMTSGIVYINGKRVIVSAVAAHAFTASKDTYVTIDDTGTVAYSAQTNDAASPTMPANSILVAIVVTAAGSIASAAKVNVGQSTATSPTVTNILNYGLDSIGQKIYPTQPLRMDSIKPVVRTFTNGSNTAINGGAVDVTGSSVTLTLARASTLFIISFGYIRETGAPNIDFTFSLLVDGTQVDTLTEEGRLAQQGLAFLLSATTTHASGSVTIKNQAATSGGTGTVDATKMIIMIYAG